MLSNLPGIQVTTIDGGLAAKRIPRTKSTIILGTSDKGVADTPYLVTDRAAAAQEFGLNGTLVKAMEEVAIYGDNIYLYRIGTSPASLAGVGAVSGGAAGFSITLGDRTSTANVDYSLWYKAGVLYVFKKGVLVYANDTSAGVTVDTGDVLVAGAATSGLACEAAAVSATPALAKTYAGSITITAAAAMSAIGTNTAPVFTAAVTGTSMTGRQLYIAQQKAFDLLDYFPIQQVCVPGAFLDAPNVAFYVSSDTTTATNNPATNTDALGWLKTTVSTSGTSYHWSNESTDSTGAAKAAVTFTNADDRISKDYHEVSFGYQLARFCSKQSEVLGGCLGFIGLKGPSRFDYTSLRDWIGYLPTYDSAGTPTASGKGMLGQPYLTGSMTNKLNSLTSENLSTGSVAYRLPGFFQTVSGEYDGGPQYDRNQNPVDLGAYVHVVGDSAYIANGYGRYTGNLANIVAGLVSALDEKSAPTNKPVYGVTQLYRANLTWLDALTQANINVLKFVNAGETPVLLHGMTMASDASDYIFMSRMRVKFMLVKALFDEGNKFIGETSTDGLQLQAMRTALDARLNEMKKRGYLQRFSYTISKTLADQRIGRAFIDITFMPPDELVQLRASVAISRT